MSLKIFTHSDRNGNLYISADFVFGHFIFGVTFVIKLICTRSNYIVQ